MIGNLVKGVESKTIAAVCWLELGKTHGQLGLLGWISSMLKYRKWFRKVLDLIPKEAGKIGPYNEAVK